MSQADAGDSQRLQLVNHLKLIEDLWQKLYYVKWNPKSFAMLARLAQDMVRNAQAGGDGLDLAGFLFRVEFQEDVDVDFGPRTP